MKEVKSIPVETIKVWTRLREINEGALAALIVSMSSQGLLNPITVARFDEETAELVAGAHRLEAAKRLGWETIEAIYIDGDDIERELHEIAENLHRAELTVLERDKQIARWVELMAVREEVSDNLSETSAPEARKKKSKGGRPGMASATAREIGANERDVRRAVKVASITPEAQQAARDAGIDDNRSALLKVAKEATPEDQVDKVKEIAESKAHAKSRSKQSAQAMEDDDDDHAAGLRVIAARGVVNHAIEAKEISAIGRLHPSDVTDAMIEAAQDAAAAWKEAAQKLEWMRADSKKPQTGMDHSRSGNDTAPANAVERRRVFMQCADDSIRSAENGAGLKDADPEEIDQEMVLKISHVLSAWGELRASLVDVVEVVRSPAVNDDKVFNQSAKEIAASLVEMEDQRKLRKVAKLINDHLEHPDRTPFERAIALGIATLSSLDGNLSKTAALAKLREPTPDGSWRVEATTSDGRRWVNGVRLRSREEAVVYAEEHVPFDLRRQGYVSADIVRCDLPPTNQWIGRARKGGQSTLHFEHGTCGSLGWHPVDDHPAEQESAA